MDIHPRVLIVEDEIVVATDLKARLGLLGYQVVGAAFGGESALGLCEQLMPDLVLMDIHLRGGIDGIEAARIIRQRWGVPVVFLTAYADDSSLENAKAAEPYGYLLKPVGDVELKTAIEIAVAKHRGDLELQRVNRLYASLSQMNQAIAAARTREKLVAAVCRVLVEHGGFKMAWVGWLDAATQRIHVAAKCGDDTGFLPPGPLGSGSCPDPTGAAVWEGHHVLVNDLQHQERLPPWPQRAAAAGFHSGAAFPLRFQGEVCAALTVYAAEADAFGTKEVTMLDEAAGSLSFALDTLEGESNQRQAETSRRESEEMFFKAFRSNPAIMAILSLNEQRHLAVNAAFETHIGYSSDEIAWFTAAEVPLWADADIFRETLRLISREGALRNAEAEWKTKKGGVLTVRLNAELVEFSGEKCVLLIAEDITEHKRNEDSLAARARQQAAVAKLAHRAMAQAELQTLLQEAAATVAENLDVEHAMVLELSPDGKQLVLRAGVGWGEGRIGEETMSAGADSLAGFTLLSPEPVVVDDLSKEKRFAASPLIASQALASSASAIIGSRDDPLGVLAALSRRRRPFTGDEITFLQSVANLLAESIRQRWAEDSVLEFRDHLADLVRLRTDELSTANEELKREVAERVRLEEELLRVKDAVDLSARSKREFLSNMSHAVCTPLNAILGFAQLMRREPALPHTLQEYVDIICRNANQLLAVMNDILEMSRLEAGRAPVQEEDVDLEAVFRDLEAMFRLRVRKKGIGLSCFIDPAVPRVVRVDSRKLRHVLINVLSNAVKFTDHGGIIVSTQLADAPAVAGGYTVRVDVEDTGCGIASEDLDKVFALFEQAADAHGKGGTGLGMPISRRYARMLGGDLTVASTKGQGTIFSFTFQALAGSGGERLTSAHERRVIGLAPDSATPKMLVVDDMAESRVLLQTMLSVFGADNIQAANDGPMAIAVCRRWRPDLVLMDRRMPGMNGLDAMQAIKAMGSTPIPVVIVSAVISDDDRQEALDASADGFLPKPIQESALFAEIARQIPGVVYRYEAQESHIPAPPEDGPELQAAARKLPGQLAAEMTRAIRAGDTAHFDDLLEQKVRTWSPALAAHLAQLAGDFEYDQIQKLLG